MADGIYVALSGAMAQVHDLESTANNLANGSTDGYQRTRSVFREQLTKAGVNDPALHYTSQAQTVTDPTVGPLRPTGRALDFAMPEGTYLAVQGPNGAESYTRAGSLQVASDGTLKTASGHAVLGQNGTPVKLSGDLTALGLDDGGQLRQGGATAGRLKLVSFPNPAMLQHLGGALLQASPQAGPPAASAGKIEVGQLEGSNANPVSAMTELVDASRNFDAFQKAIDAFRDTDRSAATTLASTSG